MPRPENLSVPTAKVIQFLAQNKQLTVQDQTPARISDIEGDSCWASFDVVFTACEETEEGPVEYEDTYQITVQRKDLEEL